MDRKITVFPSGVPVNSGHCHCRSCFFHNFRLKQILLQNQQPRYKAILHINCARCIKIKQNKNSIRFHISLSPSLSMSFFATQLTYTAHAHSVTEKRFRSRSLTTNITNETLIFLTCHQYCRSPCRYIAY